MWPWSNQPHILELLEPRTKLQNTSSTREADSEYITSNAAAGGLVLQAPGGGDDTMLTRKGSFFTAANFPVEDALLEEAISRVHWLVVRFRSGNSGALLQAEPFPSWVLLLENLRGLSLESYPHSTLPEEIGCLTQLERLHCYGSALSRVPRSIGRLQNLVELDLYTSYKLHYLPFEVLRCAKLVDSRFSTRALYANRKNNMPLPSLVPWWRKKIQAAPTSDTVRNILVRIDCGQGISMRRLPPHVVDNHILPFISWNWCSVCGVTYAHDLGCNTWSRRCVATDVQSLLAFCCSSRCARRIQDQVYFDPVDWSNKTLSESDMNTQSPPIALEEFRENLEEGIHWTEGHIKGWPFNSLSPFDLHALTGTDEPAAIPRPIAFQNENHVIRVVAVDRRMMRVVSSGDIRKLPSSKSKQLGRLRVGTHVLVDTLSVDFNGRKWARLCSYGSNHYCWTAVAKKDGTAKLSSDL